MKTDQLAVAIRAVTAGKPLMTTAEIRAAILEKYAFDAKVRTIRQICINRGIEFRLMKPSAPTYRSPNALEMRRVVLEAAEARPAHNPAQLRAYIQDLYGITVHQGQITHILHPESAEPVGKAKNKKPRGEQAKPKVRQCLMCRKNFRSEWAGERACGDCKRSHAYQTGEDHVYTARIG
jgi:hypothetical protein